MPFHNLFQIDWQYFIQGNKLKSTWLLTKDIQRGNVKSVLSFQIVNKQQEDPQEKEKKKSVIWEYKLLIQFS